MYKFACPIFHSHPNHLTPLRNLWLPLSVLWLGGVVWLICASRESWVRAMLLQLPWTDTGLEDLVLGWWLVDHVGDPGVPRWLNVCSGLLLVYDDGEESGNGVRVPFVFLVINPSCAQWKLLLHVLKVLVAEAIDADQGSGLGVTDVLPIMLD